MIYKMFLKSTDYLAFKNKMLKEDISFTDHGRTNILAMLCGCLGGSPYVMGTTHHGFSCTIFTTLVCSACFRGRQNSPDAL